MPSRVGLAIPLHTSGIGKVVLSGFTDQGLERFVERAGLPRRTDAHHHDARGAARRGRRDPAARLRDRPGGERARRRVRRRTHPGPPRHASATALSISTLTLEHTMDQVEAMAPLAVETAEQDLRGPRLTRA